MVDRSVCYMENSARGGPVLGHTQISTCQDRISGPSTSSWRTWQKLLDDVPTQNAQNSLEYWGLKCNFHKVGKEPRCRGTHAGPNKIRPSQRSLFALHVGSGQPLVLNLCTQVLLQHPHFEFSINWSMLGDQLRNSRELVAK